MGAAPLRGAVRVLYIMGNGRSGSTVLDTLLGNHADIESVGELIKLPSEAWVRNEFCACGARADTCEFWVDVRQAWDRGSGVSGPEAFIEAEAALRAHALRRRGRPVLGFRSPDVESDAYQRFARGTEALFEAIRQKSGKPIVLDSSKTALRAFHLSQLPGLDVRLVHLVRDIRGVVWSLQKQLEQNAQAGVQQRLDRRSAWQAAAKWTRTNLQSEWVRRRLSPDRSIRLRYEDFVVRPEEALDRIGRLLQLDVGELAGVVRNGRPLTVGHTIAGNRLRMAGAVRLELDEEWRRRLTPRDRRVAWGLGGWLAWRYGYRVWT